MKRGLIEYFVGNPVAAKLLMIFLILGGILAGLNLHVRQIPDLDYRTIVVTLASPGSSPREIEEDINRRIEESVLGLEGVDRVVSVASEGLGRVEVEIETFADADAVLADVKNAVDSIENFPPPSARPPRIVHKRLSVEVLSLSVSSSSLSEDGLRIAAENLRDDLLALPSVSLVRLKGTRDREISIEMSEEELRRNDLTISEVARKVRRASLNLTFGELRTGAGGVVLNVIGKRERGEEFEDIPLITRLDGSVVKLGDVARIRDGFVDEDVLSEVDGKPAIFVRVEAGEEHSVFGISSAIEDWLRTYEPPAGVEVEVWSDRVSEVLDRFSGILLNAVIGVILVFVCLVLVFDLRVAIWIAMGIPISFIGSLLFFDVSDLTLNMGTLFAFFLLIGIVVDDAVVVGESIAAEREGGKSALDAAISGARAVAGPIVVGVLTTMLAFVPLLFVTTGNYQMVKVFPLVAFFVLFVSLVEAFCILPSHLSHSGRWSLSPLSDIQVRVGVWLNDLRDAVVVPAASWAVRHIYLTFLLGVVFVVAALWLLRAEIVRVVVLDSAANVGNTIQADLELPVGAPFAATVATGQRFVRAARAINDQLEGASIESISLIVGNLAGAAGTRTGQDDANRSHLASVRLHLHKRPLRQASPEVIERLWRRNVGDVAELEKISIQTTRLRFRPGVAYALLHDDPETLRNAALELGAYLRTVPGLYAQSDSLSSGKRHLEIFLTPAGKAAGLTPAMIGKQLRANFHGLEVQRIQRGRDEIPVVVRYPAERRRSLRELASERIVRPGGQEIPLSTVARIVERRELSSLTRIDGKQAALVNAHVDFSRITAIQGRRTVAENFLPGLLAKYPGLSVARDAGARDERALLETFAVLVPIVLILMYGLMAAFLRSYWKPLVAVIGVPMAFAGGIFGHWALGWDLTAISLFGMVGVAGVIVNDALVLLDRYNRIRRENEAVPAIAAASAATRDRFRAVFLTSLTTVLGLSPLLYERSDELLFLVPFVVSMLGGLIAAGAFTLFVLPALVMFVEGRRET